MGPKQSMGRRFAPKQSGEGIVIKDDALVEIGFVREVPGHQICPAPERDGP
ncbi:hypothetical protein MesoLj131b_70550 (plasmid) [Mesorhizobium sp. 131-2-5]|nr:hypothetical protein MesoLj131b_70550 [Mesorhizobium sp. 131-2-5]